MNSLEALNKLSNHKCYEKESSCYDRLKDIYKEEILNIEQDLERLEKAKTFNVYLNEQNKLLYEENEKLKQKNQELLVNKNVAQGIATKYKKVLDILKDKFKIEVEKRFCYQITISETNELENNNYVSEFITQEEYSLLKEVLGNV